MRAYSSRHVTASVAVFGFILSSASWAGAQSAPAAPPSAAPAVAPPAPTPAPAPQLAAPPPAPPGAAPPPAAYPAYPPPGAYPAGAYPPPPPGYAYAYPTVRRPESVPYEGGPVPAGYHVEERPRRGPIIAGAVITGSAYALGLTVASTENFPNSTGWLVVPVLGPWITLAARRNTTYNCDVYSCDGTADDNNTTRTFLLLDGLTQATGAILLVYGLASDKKVIARDFLGSLRFVPSEVGRNGLGGFVLGQF